MASNITITKEDFELAKNFLIQFLRDSGYEGSLEDGTALHDLIIKAFALYYSLFKTESSKVASYLSLSHAVANKDLLGDDYDQAVDAVLSNWFVTRKTGNKSTGSIRMWFSKPLDYYMPVVGTPLASIEGEKFEPAYGQVFSYNDFTGVINTSAGTSEYFIDVDVQSSENSDVAPTYLSKPSVYANNIYFLRAEVVLSFTPGTTKEPSEDFIQRTEQAITTRELITDRAINTVVLDQFPAVRRVYVAGFGDQEQQRDVEVFYGTSVHVGNKADIYVLSPLSMKEDTFLLPSDKVINLAPVAPIGLICGVQALVGESEFVTIPFQYVSCDDKLYGSARQQQSISVPSLEAGSEVRVRYISNDTVSPVAAFVSHSKNKVVCYDPLVKMCYVVELQFNLHVNIKTEYNVAEVLAALRDRTVDFLYRINNKASVYKESEYVTYLHENIPGLDRVVVPINVTFRVFDSASNSEISAELPDMFEYSDLGAVTKQLTNNTVQFFTSPDLINITVN